MNGKWNCYDNASAERLFASLKRERVDKIDKYNTHLIALTAIIIATEDCISTAGMSERTRSCSRGCGVVSRRRRFLPIFRPFLGTFGSSSWPEKRFPDSCYLMLSPKAETLPFLETLPIRVKPSLPWLCNAVITDNSAASYIR